MKKFNCWKIKTGLLLLMLIMGFINTSLADEKAAAKKLEFSGRMDAYYKNQTDYHTPLDAGSVKYRHGANNRSKQTVRSYGLLTGIVSMNPQTTAGTNWHAITGVAQLAYDTDDPDNSETEDGKRRDSLQLRDVWIRYAPLLPIGIKIGSQTVTATANARNTYYFRGDTDDDFVLYTGSALIHTPGVSLDLHLSKELELGMGQLEGMSDLSAIATYGRGHEALNNVYWIKGKGSIIHFMLGYQDISVGGQKTEENPATTHYARAAKHTLANLSLRLAFENIEPFLGYQKLKGDKTTTLVNNDKGYITASNALGLGIKQESTKVELAISTLGLLATTRYGQIIMDYTVVETPGFNQKGAALAGMGVHTVSHFNYNYSLNDDSEVTFFFNQLKAKKDQARDNVEQNIRNNQETIDGIAGAGTTATVVDGFEVFEWTDTRSLGIAWEIRFKL